jgi:hypothetical protein
MWIAQRGIQNIIEEKMNKYYWTVEEYEGFIDDEK